MQAVGHVARPAGTHNEESRPGGRPVILGQAQGETRSARARMPQDPRFADSAISKTTSYESLDGNPKGGAVTCQE